MDKVYNAIAPATSVENISLDYNGTVCFGDLYQYDGKIIGAGGFGVVLLARDKSNNDDVAIKILNISRYLLSGTENRKDMGRESIALSVERSLNFLKNEVTIMQGTLHPAIIRLRKVHKSQHHVLIVMDRAKCSLSDYIKKHKGKVPIEEVKIILRQIMQGLQYLHIQNIAHRDMKPGNILLMSTTNLSQSVKITDFSISAKLNDALPYELFDTAGTFLYKAPEQFTGSLSTTVFFVNLRENASIQIYGLLG